MKYTFLFIFYDEVVSCKFSDKYWKKQWISSSHCPGSLLHKTWQGRHRSVASVLFLIIHSGLICKVSHNDRPDTTIHQTQQPGGEVVFSRAAIASILPVIINNNHPLPPSPSPTPLTSAVLKENLLGCYIGPPALPPYWDWNYQPLRPTGPSGRLYSLSHLASFFCNLNNIYSIYKIKMKSW